jgi:hypothetical protein
MALPRAALSQAFVSAELGFASADYTLGAPFNGAIDDNSIMYGAKLGFSFHKHFAAEIAVNGYGSFDGRATPCAVGASACTQIVQAVDGNDVNVYRILLMPYKMIGNVQLFGEIGYFRMKTDTNIDFADSTFKDRGVALGAGGRWYFKSSPWSVSVQAGRLESRLYQVGVGFGWGLRPPTE